MVESSKRASTTKLTSTLSTINATLTLTLKFLLIAFPAAIKAQTTNYTPNPYNNPEDFKLFSNQFLHHINTTSTRTEPAILEEDETGRVGICYNLIKSFIPVQNIDRRKQKFSRYLIQNIKNLSEFKYVFPKGKNYLKKSDDFKQKLCNDGDFRYLEKNKGTKGLICLDIIDPGLITSIDQEILIRLNDYETSRLLCQWVAFTTNNFYSITFDKFKESITGYVQKIYNFSLDVNSICRRALTYGFFNIQGLNKTDLKLQISQYVKSLQEELNKEGISKANTDEMRRMMDIPCKHNLTLMRKNNVESLFFQIVEWMGQVKDKVREKRLDNIFKKLNVNNKDLKNATCSIIKDYFNEMQSPSIGTVEQFLSLLGYRYALQDVYSGESRIVEAIDRSWLRAKKKTVTYFINQILEDQIKYFKKEWFPKKNLVPEQYQDVYIKIEVLLPFDRDTYFQVDLLMTTWLLRRKEEVYNFFKQIHDRNMRDNNRKGGKVSEGESEAGMLREFTDYAKTVIVPAVDQEFKFVASVIQLGSLSLKEQGRAKANLFLEQQAKFLYIYLHHNYKAIKALPLSQTGKFLTKIMDKFYDLRKRFIFTPFAQLSFSVQKTLSMISTGLFDAKLQVHIQNVKRNRLYYGYCEELYKEKFEARLPDSVRKSMKKEVSAALKANLIKVCKSEPVRSFLDVSSLKGVRPLSIVSYSYVDLVYDALRLEMRITGLKAIDFSKKFSKDDGEVVERLVATVKLLEVNKMRASAILASILEKKIKNLDDYFNVILVGFYFFSGQEMTLSITNLKIRTFFMMINKQSDDLKILFKRHLKHFDTILVIDKYKLNEN